AAHLQRRGAGAEPAPRGRGQEPPVDQDHAPGHARGRHLVRPHRAVAAARVAGLPPGCERMEGRTQSAVLGGGRRALATVAAGLGAVLAPWCWLSGLSWRGSALAGAVGGCKPSTQACSALAAL